MQGAVQTENLVKKAKNYIIISTYMNIKRKDLDGVRYERWHAHDLTSDQVHGRSTSNVVRKRLVRVCFRKFLKTSIL